MNKLKKIFVVEDDEMDRFLASKIITKAAIAEELTFFKNGRVAIDYLVQHLKDPELLPDVLFLDINMPVLNGWGFLDEFKNIDSQLSKKITIFIVSSSITLDDREMALIHQEVSAFITKPYSVAKLQEILSPLLQER